MIRLFSVFATRASKAAGSFYAFAAAVCLVVVWALAGPYFGWSEAHSLAINTLTTIVTFLMVFLIQNTQNRDALAMHLKLDELIRSIEAADDTIIRAEDETDEELAVLKQKYEALCDEHAELQARLDQSTRNGRAALVEPAFDVPERRGEPGEPGTARG